MNHFPAADTSVNEKRQSFQNINTREECLNLDSELNMDEILGELEMLRMKVAEQETQIRKLSSTGSNFDVEKSDASLQTSSTFLFPDNKTQPLENCEEDKLSPLKTILLETFPQKNERYSLDGQSRFAASESDITRMLTPQVINKIAYHVRMLNDTYIKGLFNFFREPTWSVSKNLLKS